ncbi:hypothetical protein PVAND_007650 [Polypedilum vanderplanki]|uniref:G-protein coupled receptors family 1 profile domain-containing protein n=1 Tax=Polypedilum vanderplanki TaxID=319348 RepID=A0A9J6C7U6_POLVA|nr:hypothetical protein PVAND_007650 [Polypedilum vanderplanki]
MRSVFKATVTLLLLQSVTISIQIDSSPTEERSEIIFRDEDFLKNDVINTIRRNVLDDKTVFNESDLQKAQEILPLSLSQQQQDVKHLSDLNGSDIVSSLYVGERTTIKSLSEETMTMSNISLLALTNFIGTIDGNFLKRINTHWLKFPPQPPSAHYTLATIYFIMAMFGLTGNALVIFLFIKCSSVRTPANNFILNLAISDFIIMLEAPIFIYNSFHLGPKSGDFACRVYGLMGATGGTVAIITLTAISIDRYNVIVYPLNPSRSTTNIRSRLMILFVWLYSLPFCLVPFFEIGGVGGYIPEGFLTACSFDYLDTSPKNYWFIFIYAMAAFFVPLTIITYCYIHILYVVLSAKKIQSSKEKNRTEVRLAFIVISIVGLWCAAWTPYCIVALMGISGYIDNITPLASMIPAITAKFAACIDPYLYAMTHPRFRKELEKIFCNTNAQSVSNYQTSIYSRGPSRRRGRTNNDSECESIEINSIRRPHYNQAESSFCENSGSAAVEVPAVKC